MNFMSSPTEFVLQVGETAHVKRSFLGASFSVIYAGMPGDAVFSVIVTSASGYHAIAYNLFLSAAQTRINLPKGYLVVQSVSAEQIQLTLGH